MVSSLLAEMVATCWIFTVISKVWLLRFQVFTTSETALSIRSFEIHPDWLPAATIFKPSLMMLWARTVAVVVPSPAISAVLKPFFHHLGAHILDRSSSFFGYGPHRLWITGAQFLLDDHIAAFGPECHFYSIGRVSAFFILLRASISK